MKAGRTNKALQLNNIIMAHDEFYSSNDKRCMLQQKNTHFILGMTTTYPRETTSKHTKKVNEEKMRERRKRIQGTGCYYLKNQPQMPKSRVCKAKIQIRTAMCSIKSVLALSMAKAICEFTYLRALRRKDPYTRRGPDRSYC